MKEIFFKGVAIAIPLAMILGIVYMIFHGFYSLYSDWQLKKELEQIRRDSVSRRRQRAESASEMDQPQADSPTP